MSHRLIEYLTLHKPVQPLYLMLDNDMSDQNATVKLASRLQNAHIPSVVAPLDPTYKDTNEVLVANPDTFAASIAHAEKLAESTTNKKFSFSESVTSNDTAPEPITAATMLADLSKSDSIDNNDSTPSDSPNPNAILTR